MITLEEYFGKWEHTEEHTRNAEVLLKKVAIVLEEAFASGVDFHVNPLTNSYVAGETLGGFRPQDAKIGSAKSAHKEAMAIDVYDPMNDIDQWCIKHQSILQQCGLYLEDPKATPKWCHLSTRAPASWKTVFQP